MNYQGHLKMAAVFGIAAHTQINLPLEISVDLPLYYAGVLLGGLLPDIDHPKSYISKKLKIISWVFSLFFTHRTITHSLLGIAILGLLISKWIPMVPFFNIGLLVGCISHLFADMCTPAGIPLFYPFKRKYGFRR